MTPADLMEEMAARYASCACYRDSGTVVTEHLRADGNTTKSVRPFQTALVRPHRFRFEFRDRFNDAEPWQRYVVWRDGTAVRTRWDVTGREESPESLDLALAGATGVSAAAAHTIPALLLPNDVSGFRLPQLVDLTFLESHIIAGEACLRISGRHPPRSAQQEARIQEMSLRRTGRAAPRVVAAPTILWIHEATLSLWRLEDEHKFDTFVARTTTEYSPEFNGIISDEDLAFDREATA